MDVVIKMSLWLACSAETLFFCYKERRIIRERESEGLCVSYSSHLT